MTEQLTPEDIYRMAQAGDRYAAMFLSDEDLDFYGEVDANMLALICELNAMPGIRTFASCGGHRRPGEGQQPAGKWFVSFQVMPGEYTSLLRLLGRAATCTAGFVTLKTTVSAGSSDVLQCVLDGDGSDPQELAERLRRKNFREVLQEQAAAS